MFDLVSFIKIAGVLGVGGMVFVESGLLIGFFLPGDSLLFTAGVLASQGYLTIWLLIPVAFVAAVAGDSVGYFIGKRGGQKLFTNEKSFWFNPNQITKAHVFFEKHGSKTLILARFLPAVRAVVPVIAGIGEMNYHTFLVNNVIGAALWAIGLPLLGYYLGKAIPNIDQYLLPIIILIIIFSLIPSFIGLLRRRKKEVGIS